jgi:hypothetical protein
MDNSPSDLTEIIEHYRYIDSIAKDSFGTPDNSEHIGDPDYHRIPCDT